MKKATLLGFLRRRAERPRLGFLVVGWACTVLVASCEFRGTRSSANEASATRRLCDYYKAQQVFASAPRYSNHRERMYANPKVGLGLVDLYQVGGLGGDGQPLHLIEYRLAVASAGGPNPTPYFGYLFAEVLEGPKGPYDHRFEFGLCAYPAKYPEWGRKTIIINHAGTMLERDTEGKPVVAWPSGEEAAEWEAIPWQSIPAFR